MDIVIAFLGILMVVAAAIGVESPSRFTTQLVSIGERRLFGIAVGFRLAFGIAFILGASATRYPAAILALGWIASLAAIALLLVGQARFARLIAWWTRRSDSLVRVACLFGMAFGCFVIYAAT